MRRDQLVLTFAGVTVGFVVVPQGMAYALLAQLPPEYGLYTSFVGFLLYWAFATSKDITIGVSTPLKRTPAFCDRLLIQCASDRCRHVDHCRQYHHLGARDESRISS